MKYAVNEEGVSALRTAASEITEAVDQLKNLTSGIQNTADENPDGLGPHKASLVSALENIKEQLNRASEPADSVAETLEEVAEGYQEIIDNDRFAGAAGN